MSSDYHQDSIVECEQYLYQLIRSKTVNDGLRRVLPEDFKPNRDNYLSARNFFAGHITDCQPYVPIPALRDMIIDPTKSNRGMFKITSSCSTPSIGLLVDWFFYGVLSVGLGETTRACTSIYGLQATAGQYNDDNVISSGAKLGFGLGALILLGNEDVDLLYWVSEKCMGMVTLGLVFAIKEAYPFRDEGSKVFWTKMYSILRDVAQSNFRSNRRGMKDLKRNALARANDIDSVTDSRMSLARWVSENWRN